MATVTSFQALPFPGKSELRQFAELFQPLYAHSSLEARRDAVAALSQSPNLPLSIAAFIASQPIAIAAPFLAASPALTDDMLIMIARTQGADHARAIVKRERLSPTVIDALVGLRHALPPRPDRLQKTAAAVAPAVQPAAPATVGLPTSFERTMADLEMNDLAGAVAANGTPAAVQPDAADDRSAREEMLRQTIKRLAYQQKPAADDRLGRRQIGPVQTALLVRFARALDGGAFATTLSDLLTSSRWLAERILLDISGRQLATTLAGVAMAEEESIFILEHIYPHLARSEAGESRARALLASIDADQAEARIDSWLRADRYTFGGTEQPTPERGADGFSTEDVVRSARTAASRKPVGDEHARQVLRARKR
ncbi:DUF2336 domain-containing protein [Rhizobium glycinendophyticum]|uniref:DUF2336 domain-containing protein n=1 Tax=Rhizobium glycinendophyticum TaxID=2589807 RepID=A0A504UE54_9HYPH|nr:DUF2336 domain-containing protein [Rhizobium glycinendophyticum]TPP12057.1 DUF2336 domain-containing protein [Rhizobium glycinendophyticum]